LADGCLIGADQGRFGVRKSDEKADGRGSFGR